MAIDNLQPLIYACVSVAFFLGTAAGFLRLYCRAFITKACGWDDAGTIFLIIFNTMLHASMFIILHYGCGKHIGTLLPYQVEHITIWFLIEQLLYMFMHWTVKMAFLFFYLRLSPSVTFRRCVIATMVINTAFFIMNSLLVILQCQPFDAILHRALHPEAKCISTSLLLMGPAVLNIITDLILVGLPIPIIRAMQMSLGRKIAVLLIFGVGVSSVITAACRFIVLADLARTTDTSYVLGKMVIVNVLEIDAAVIAVNLPSMKPLYPRITGDSGVDENASYKLHAVDNKKNEAFRGKHTQRLDPESITHHVGDLSANGSEERLCETSQQAQEDDELKATRSSEARTLDEELEYRRNQVMTKIKQEMEGK